eukprot:symbB.v1.2.019196.t1/scaffold1512.1/size114451/7
MFSQLVGSSLAQRVGQWGSSIAMERTERRRSPLAPFLAVSGCVALAAVLCKGVEYWQAFAPPPGAKRKRAAAPYGRIGGRPIIPNPEAEKFPAGVPRDEDGFPVITLREQYETNVTMYVEGLGPFPGPPPDFSADWDYIPPDPEDEDFDPDAPLPPVPPDPPQELMEKQPAGAVQWPEVTTRAVAAGPEASAIDASISAAIFADRFLSDQAVRCAEHVEAFAIGFGVAGHFGLGCPARLPGAPGRRYHLYPTGFLSNRNLVTGRGATITMNTNHREKKYQGDEDNTSLASWAVISDKDAAVSDHADWFMVDESTESMELMEHDMPEKTLDSLVGPLRINGIDFSQISFLLGEWIDSLGHSVSVVATGGCSARARISWDHKGQKKTQLWKTFLKVYREEGGPWICGNGQLLSAAIGRLQWQRDDGSCTEWIRTLPASAAFLSAYVKPSKAPPSEEAKSPSGEL